MKLGVIADDFTGATDIASFLVRNGMRTVQLCGVTPKTPVPNADAVVISHKSRSCPADEAVAQTQASLQWLLKHDCPRFYFKYCSTFDSTAKGNIGPVTDALMQTLGVKFTVFSPALPVNGRTVYKGYLFAGDELLEDSGMRHHPITPMTDSRLVRLVEMQSKGKCASIPLEIVRSGVNALLARIHTLGVMGYSYAVLDALDTNDLIIQGEAVKDMPLVTGGSGLAIGLARALCGDKLGNTKAYSLGYPQGDKAIVFSGSCSVMTNKQVAFYKKYAASQLVDADKLMAASDLKTFVAQYADFCEEHSTDDWAPLIYATANPKDLDRIQKQYGVEKSSHAVEEFFAELSRQLKARGFTRFIIAGGETSSITVKALEVPGFYIGPSIAPGVPWVRSINNDISLTLKSGNFGEEDFFLAAQQEFPV